jgi:hypothetical protein
MLAASGSATGASREVFRVAPINAWDLITTPYAIEEVFRNLPQLTPSAGTDWMRLRRSLRIMNDVLTLDRPAVFDVAKDRPILFGALAWAEVLLTLDRGDFGKLIGTSFYGLSVLPPGTFLEQQRAAGALRLA